VFWYEAATKVDLPFNIVGLVAFQILTMQWVELRRWQDLRNPNSVNQDPIFSQYKLPDHEVGSSSSVT
jgi:light-harvesting complex I chlorophyll a/b binding protein 4